MLSEFISLAKYSDVNRAAKTKVNGNGCCKPTTQQTAKQRQHNTPWQWPNCYY